SGVSEVGEEEGEEFVGRTAGEPVRLDVQVEQMYAAEMSPSDRLSAAIEETIAELLASADRARRSSAQAHKLADQASAVADTISNSCLALRTTMLNTSDKFNSTIVHLETKLKKAENEVSLNGNLAAELHTKLGGKEKKLASQRKIISELN